MITTLSELLTPAQIKAVKAIIKAEPDSLRRVKKLKAYLAEFKDELERKGVAPDYLAYVIEHIHLNADLKRRRLT